MSPLSLRRPRPSKSLPQTATVQTGRSISTNEYRRRCQGRSFTTETGGVVGRGHARPAGHLSAGLRAGVWNSWRGTATSWGGVAISSNPLTTYRNLAERRKVPQWGPGRSPGANSLFTHYCVWKGGGAVVQRVRHLGLRSVGRGFKFCSRQRCVTTLGKLFTPLCLCHQAV